jgi:hypothetical protein
MHRTYFMKRLADEFNRLARNETAAKITHGFLEMR